jgi:hypothetical protein
MSTQPTSHREQPKRHEYLPRCSDLGRISTTKKKKKNNNNNNKSISAEAEKNTEEKWMKEGES